MAKKWGCRFPLVCFRNLVARTMGAEWSGTPGVLVGRVRRGRAGRGTESRVLPGQLHPALMFGSL
jgi:hypothetical protein